MRPSVSHIPSQRDISVPQTTPLRQTHRKILPCATFATVNQSSIVCFTQLGIGTVRMCPPFPTRSTIAQRSSRRWMWSSVRSMSSLLRSPQPRRTARMARSLLPFTLCLFGSCHRERASSTVNQFPSRMPSFFAPFTRRMPAASSGLRSPVSAAS
jgi:hypothetical protein